MTRLQNKIAIITGGSTGIGRATAKRLAEEGAKVVITGRNETTLKESADQHANISYIVGDVSKPDDVDKVIDSVLKDHHAIDILVNNAGVAFFAPLADVSLEHIDSQFDINVRGLIYMSKKALAHLQKSKGVIINNASVVGEDPMAGGAVYSATKAAVIALTKAWAKELAPQQVRVNAVSPGPIETPIFAKTGMPQDALDQMAGQIVASVPLARFGQPEDIAATIAYLASGDASFVTGAEVKVDGGYAA